MTRIAAFSVPASNARTSSHHAADDWSGSADDASPGHASLDSLVTQAPLIAAPANLTYPLSYFMRTDIGKGPLELLVLKGFVLPNRMFIEKTRVTPPSNDASPPPLPKTAREAAKQAATPLPSGDLGHSL
jgi:type VI secretion system protein ImpL